MICLPYYLFVPYYLFSVDRIAALEKQQDRLIDERDALRPEDVTADLRINTSMQGSDATNLGK